MTDDRPVLPGELEPGDLVTERRGDGSRQDVWLVGPSGAPNVWHVRQGNGYERMTSAESRLIRRRARYSRGEAADTAGVVLQPGQVHTLSVGGQQVSVAVDHGGPSVEVIVRLAQRGPRPVGDPSDPSDWR